MPRNDSPMRRIDARQRYGPDFHLDRQRFDTWLGEHARLAGVEFVMPGQVRLVEFARDEGFRVTAETAAGTRRFEAAHLVDASGRAAWLARKLGAHRSVADPLLGIARWYQCPVKEPSILVETAEHGWWYSAPLPAGKLVALFVTDGGTPSARAARADVWQSCLATAPLTRARLLAASSDGPPVAYASAPALSEWDPSVRFLPVGDAALAFDPIAADGLCYALRSGLEAARAFALCRAGQAGALNAYRRGLGDIFRNHLARREALYKLERGRRGSPFWQRARDGSS